ncbi:MAG: metallophosphoesterase [Myxococcales bacterium]|nr:metallophosphoesterase [Myxococcales bacterium]
MKLYAISDLHVGYEANRRYWQGLGHHPQDWLILAGDLGETEAHLRFALGVALARFARVLWVPGNHELWTLPGEVGGLRGLDRYARWVEVCRELGVLTPEDPFVVWPGEGPRCVLAPLFLLYDYSFRPDSVPQDQALAWAREAGIECVDEVLLHPDPFPTRSAWCQARCQDASDRLAAIDPALQTVLINHFPLRRELARLPAIPRFSIWCGTTLTEDWHRTYRAAVVVSGHLHIRSTQWIDGVRFEEVSLGYPRQRSPSAEVDSYLRQILPQPSTGGG